MEFLYGFIGIIIAGIVGFVAGALVYRNNVKKITTELGELKEKYEAIKK